MEEVGKSTFRSVLFPRFYVRFICTLLGYETVFSLIPTKPVSYTMSEGKKQQSACVSKLKFGKRRYR